MKSEELLERIRAAARAQPGTQDVIRQAMMCFPAEVVVLVECTGPLLEPVDVTKCLAALEQCDLAVAVIPFPGVVFSEDWEILNLSVAQCTERRQDRRPQYQLAGTCYAARAAYWHNESWLSGHVHGVLAQNQRHLDIDTWDDFYIAPAMVPNTDARWQLC